ncbi:MAG: hypothetical protein Q9160_007944 [Pyrenula sp. 1 TL-2023]
MSAADLDHESDSSSTKTNSRTNALNVGAHGELSPPRSQDPMGDQGQTIEMADAPLHSDGLMEEGELSPEDHVKRDDSGKYIPGADWNNKRAQEDFQRAMENVVDKDFSLKEFGDPLIDTRKSR